MKHYLLFVTQLYSFSVLRPLQAAILARGDKAAWYLHNIDPHHLLPDEQQLHSIHDVKAYNPIAVYVPTNWAPDFFPGIKVEIFHGFNVGKRANTSQSHFRIRGYFDLYCTQGANTTQPFQALAQQHKYFHVAETGWTKVDPLFQPTTANSVQKYRGTNDRPVVLYASTFSPTLSSAATLFTHIKKLSQQAKWHWLITLHPKMDATVVKKFRALAGPYLQFIEAKENLLPLLQAADVMLCDTSSIALEFMLLDKPLVTFQTHVPGQHLINVKNTDEIEAAIEQALSRPAVLMHAAREYMNQLHPYRDGKSSERVLEATDNFIQNNQAHLETKPLNLIRRLKIRKAMQYYKWQ